MRPYKRIQRKSTVPALLARVLLLAAAAAGLFFLLRLAIQNIGVPPLHADAIRQGLASKRALAERIAELEQELGEAATLIDQAALLQRENEQLKEELGRAAHPGGVLARVLTTPDRTFYGTMLIDAGSADGVQLGQVAYAFGSIALGTVADVRERQAVVELFSAPERETAGTAEGSSTAVTLLGRGAGEYEVRMPRDVHFAVGEFVTLQSVHTAVLARIERIATDPRDPFQRLLAKAPVNMQALKFVIVR